MFEMTIFCGSHSCCCDRKNRKKSKIKRNKQKNKVFVNTSPNRVHRNGNDRISVYRPWQWIVTQFRLVVGALGLSWRVFTIIFVFRSFDRTNQSVSTLCVGFEQQYARNIICLEENKSEFAISVSAIFPIGLGENNGK